MCVCSNEIKLNLTIRFQSTQLAREVEVFVFLFSVYYLLWERKLSDGMRCKVKLRRIGSVSVN